MANRGDHFGLGPPDALDDPVDPARQLSAEREAAISWCGPEVFRRPQRAEDTGGVRIVVDPLDHLREARRGSRSCGELGVVRA